MSTGAGRSQKLGKALKITVVAVFIGYVAYGIYDAYERRAAELEAEAAERP